jgi:hypothetical protein
MIPPNPSSEFPAPGRFRQWIPELSFLLVTTAAGVWAGGRWLDPTGDRGIWWSLLERIAAGERYYRDLYLQYGPLSPYLLSLVARPFHFSALSILLLNWIPAVTAGILLLRAARPFLSNLERLCLCAILMGVCLFAPGSGRLAFSYCPAAVHALCFSLAALLTLQPGGSRRFRGYLAGVLAGLAFCAKPEVGIAAVTALSASVFAQPKGARGWLAQCLGSFCLVGFVGAVFVLSSASFESLRLDSHVWPIALAPPEEWKMLFRIVAGIGPGLPGRILDSLRGLVFYACLFALIGLLFARERRISRVLPIAGLMAALLLGDAIEGRLLKRNLGFVHLWMTLAFLVAFLALLDRKRERRDFLVAFGIFAGLVGSRSAFSGDISNPYAGVAHLPGALTLLLFLFCFLPQLLPGGGAAARLTRLTWAIALLPVVSLGALIGIVSLAPPNHRSVETPRGRIWVAEGQGALMERVAQELRPAERVLVLPETNAIDVLFGARNASPFLIHMPGWLDRRAEEILIRKFSRDPPDVIVIFERPTWEFGVAPFGKGFGLLLSDWIERNTRLVYAAREGRILRRSGGP